MKKHVFPILLALCAMLGLAMLFPGQAQAAAAPKYRIEVDLKNQIVTVFRLSDNAIARQMVCSSGVNNKTPRGTFYLKTRKSTDRKSWYHICPKWYVRYATRITGPYLFHSVPYTKPNLNYLVKSQYKKLGSVASAGCVRLTWENAKWISDNCVDGTEVRIFANAAVNRPIKAALMEATYALDSGLTYSDFLASSYVTTEPGALGRGSDSDKVLRLQNRLAGLGLLSGNISGDYDNATIAAVLRYQRDTGAQPTGIASAALIDQIMADETHTDSLSTLQIDVNGPLVTQLQQTLKAIGIYSGDVTGVYDSALADAVNIFSIYNGTGGTRKASPSLQSAAKALLDELNARFGEGNFDIVLRSEITRTVTVKAKTTLYKSASTRAKKLKTVAKGRKVTLVSEGKTWFKVSYGGKTGYVKAGKLKSTYTTRFTLYWGIPVEALGEQTLSADNIGPAVTALQDRLRALGFYAGPGSDRYSDAVRSAVADYQLAAGLEATGEADAALQQAMLERDDIAGVAVEQGPGASNPAVAAMQRTLKALQYFDGECTGDYDDETAAAVKLFTRSNGFGESAIASPAVQQAIRDQYADCESTYGSGNYRLVITEVETPMAQLKKAEKLYSKASTSGKNLKSGSKGATVIVISKGSKWSRVQYGGKTGYMRNSRLRFYTQIDYVAEFNPPSLDDAPLAPAADDAQPEAVEQAEEIDDDTPADEPEAIVEIASDDGLEIEYDSVPEAQIELEAEAEPTVELTNDASEVPPDESADDALDEAA